MKKNLNTYTFILFFTALIGVLLIGGLSLFMVKTIMGKVYLIEKEVKNEDLVNTLHNQTYKLALSIQHSLIVPEEQDIRQISELFHAIDTKLQLYLAYEQQAGYPEAMEEVRLLTLLAANLDGMQRIATVSSGRMPIGVLDQEKLVFLDQHVEEIERIIGEINALHFAIISRKISKANDRMAKVVSLYLFFSGLGIVLVAAGYKLHAQHVVAPLRQLVEATQALAAGNPGRPLPTESMTEIGLLCESFNRMAQTIQTNEAKLLRFNQELEQKVGERTRELEEACVFLKKVQDELMRLERLATIGQIATSVNHEIKTPLNSLSMNLQLLSREKKRCCNGCDIATSRIDEAILLIAQEVARISDILDEFVRYARFAPPVLRPSDLNAIVRNVVDLLSERAEAARVCFRLSLTEGLPSLLLDENKMIQALINLCLNAIQAMPDGGEITMETRAAADGVILIVADTGPGIGPADRERIFQPFFTTKAMGLGFGLPIVQKIVEDHAGRITCQNGTSLGACFELWLPECSVSKEKTQA